jgi:hypothetical protein
MLAMRCSHKKKKRVWFFKQEEFGKDDDEWPSMAIFLL